MYSNNFNILAGTTCIRCATYYWPAAPLNISALTSNLEALRRAVTVVANTPMKPHVSEIVERSAMSFSTWVVVVVVVVLAAAAAAAV